MHNAMKWLVWLVLKRINQQYSIRGGRMWEMTYCLGRWMCGSPCRGHQILSIKHFTEDAHDSSLCLYSVKMAMHCLFHAIRFSQSRSYCHKWPFPNIITASRAVWYPDLDIQKRFCDPVNWQTNGLQNWYRVMLCFVALHDLIFRGAVNAFLSLHATCLLPSLMLQSRIL